MKKQIKLNSFKDNNHITDKNYSTKINNYYNKIFALFIFIFLIIPINSTNLNIMQSNQQNLIIPELNNLLKYSENQNSNLINRFQTLGSSTNSFTITAGELSEAKFLFGCENNFFDFALRGKYQDFVLFNKSRPVFITSSKNDMMIFSNYLKAKNGINFNGNFKIKSIPQWRLIHEEDFSVKPIGWSKNVVTECGGVKMLGGYCQFGAGEVLKTFENIPVHTQLRIEATYHFIDAWHSEVGFMRINNGKDNEMQYAWIENYSAFSGDHGINVCGGKWPEGKFSVPINISIPHKTNSVKIGFGSTTEQDPCDESFGVSGIRIYIR